MLSKYMLEMDKILRHNFYIIVLVNKVMGIRGDVLDLTDLQRRGLLKKAEEIQKQNSGAGKVDSGGYVDMSTFQKTEPAVSGESAANPLGFLDSLASTNSSSISNYSSGSNGDSLELQGLKSKIEDLEYKLDRLMEKIAKLEESRL